MIPLRDRPLDSFLVLWFSPDTPLWLRIMCGIDAFVFGPFYLVLIYALVRRRSWIRVPALLYGAAIVYSTAVYFGYEILDPANRAEANLVAVFLVNIPFTIVPLLLIWRMRRRQPFRPSQVGITFGRRHPTQLSRLGR